MCLVFYTNFRSGDARCKGPTLSPKATQQKPMVRANSLRYTAPKSFCKDTLPIGCIRNGNCQRQRQKTCTPSQADAKDHLPEWAPCFSTTFLHTVLSDKERITAIKARLAFSISETIKVWWNELMVQAHIPWQCQFEPPWNEMRCLHKSESDQSETITQTRWHFPLPRSESVLKITYLRFGIGDVIALAGIF